MYDLADSQRGEGHMSTDGDIAALTYEQALAELDTRIQRLEGGAVNLDEAIACYKRASRLAQRCAELLDRTEQKITQLVVGPSGAQERAFSPETVPTGAPAPSGTAGAGPGSPAGGGSSAVSGAPRGGGGVAGGGGAPARGAASGPRGGCPPPPRATPPPPPPGAPPP